MSKKQTKSVKLTGLLKKIFNFISIFIISLGSTFGTMNAANANDTLSGDSASGPGTIVTGVADTALAIDGSETLTMLSHAATLTQADGGAAQIFGAISATTGKLTLTSTQETSAASQTIASYTGTDSDIQITTAGDQNHTVIFTGAVTTGAVTGTIVIDGDAGDATQTLVQVGGDLTGVVSLDDNAGTVTLEMTGDDTTIGQAVNSVGGDNEAILKLSGAGTTVSSAVGTGTDGSFQQINIDGTATFSAASEAAAYTVDANTTFTGAVTANTSFTVDSSAAVTLSAASDLSLATITTGTLTSDALLTTSDLINTAGKVYLNVAANEMGAGRYAAGDGAELHVGKAFVTTNAITISDDANGGATDFHSGSKIYLPSNLTSGETLVLTDSGKWDATSGDASTAATAVDATLQDTALVNYSASASVGDTDIVITATDRTVAAVAAQLGTTENDATAALKVMVALDANDTSGDTAAYDAFDNALKAQGGYGAAEDTAFLKQTAPQTDLISGSIFAAQAVTGSVQGIMSNRMASLRSGDAYFGTGVSAGGMSAQSGFIQVFGSIAEQESKTVGSGTQAGYDSETEGLAIGFDGVSDNGMTIGLSLATANTDVDGKGTGNSTNSIDSYSASLYMDMATDSGYVEGSVTVGLNENTTSRSVTSAGLSRTYTGSYDSTSLSLNISAGAPNEVGNGYLTPFGSLTVTNMDTDAYTETSTVASDALRLKLDQNEINSQVGTLGVKYHTEMGNGGIPMISLAINNEFGDKTIDSTNTYQGGGTAFKTTTAVEELSATLGLGYSYGSDSTSIELAYEADVNDDDYLSHYGSIKIVGKF